MDNPSYVLILEVVRCLILAAPFMWFYYKMANKIFDIEERLSERIIELKFATRELDRKADEILDLLDPKASPSAKGKNETEATKTDSRRS